MNDLQDKIKELEGMIDVQCSDGNWNYDPYMQGMANGMIYAKSVLDGKEPKFKSAPKNWLRDKPKQTGTMEEIFDAKTLEEKLIKAEMGLVMDLQFAVEAAMKKRGLTMDDLGKLLGCSKNNISKFLKDDANPSVRNIGKMLGAMDEKFEFRTQTLNDL